MSSVEDVDRDAPWPFRESLIDGRWVVNEQPGSVVDLDELGEAVF